MNKQQISTKGSAVRAEALARCYEAYGADRAKWPLALREDFADFELDAHLEKARDEAAVLDEYLSAATQPRISADFKNKIMASYSAPQSTEMSGWLPRIISNLRFLPQGAPAGIAASVALGVGALGMVTGVATANMQASSAPEYEAYAYLEQSVFVFDEEEAAIWDED